MFPEEERNVYEIYVEGAAGPVNDERMEKWKSSVTPGGETRFSGPVRDSAELYGVLACLRDRGFTIIRVNRINQSDTPMGEGEKNE